MSNSQKKITTYSDLLEEKQRLETLLAARKEDISQNWEGIKQHFIPVTNAISFMGKISSRKKMGPLMDFGIDIAGDYFFRRILLSRADWVTRLLLPIFMKNYSANFLQTPKGRNFINKIKRILGRRKKHGVHEEPIPGMDVQNENIRPVDPLSERGN